MKHKVLIYLFAILYVFASSCQLKIKNVDIIENSITSLNFSASFVPNPDVIVFIIRVDKYLKELLLSNNWDSINYSGGIFDTINYSDRRINFIQTENPNELLFGLRAYNFFQYSQCQMDSITSLTFKEVEINIYYKEEHWKLKTFEKDAEE